MGTIILNAYILSYCEVQIINIIYNFCKKVDCVTLLVTLNSQSVIILSAKAVALPSTYHWNHHYH